LDPVKLDKREAPASLVTDEGIASDWTFRTCTARYEELLHLLFAPVSAVDDRMCE